MEDTYADLNRFLQITEGLDERGLVLSLAAFAEEALADLISAFLQLGEAEKSLLNGFNAPIGTFSSRIKAAYALNLITSRQHDNLNRLRKIRNEFAHNWEIVSFGDQPSASHIAALQFSPLVEKFPKNQVEKVQLIISALLTELISATHKISREKLSSRYLGIELIPGLSVDVEDERAECEKHLEKTTKELQSATGERHSYLLAQQERWTALLDIIRLNDTARGRV